MVSLMGRALCRHLIQPNNNPPTKHKSSVPVLAPSTGVSRRTVFFLFFLFLSSSVGVVLYSGYIGNQSGTEVDEAPAMTTMSRTTNRENPPRIRLPPLDCRTSQHSNLTCPAPPAPETHAGESDGSCPEYFRWIHEDLRPWNETGVTEQMVMDAQKTANFRLTVVDGRAYVTTYEKSFQTRDVFTVWGILQLLRKYPGRIPDVDLMFDCVDWPVVRTSDYAGPVQSKARPPPPLFRYCGDEQTLDIVFPDWSFWGWPEINIKPWARLPKELKRANRKMRWLDREPYAYWKGNPSVAKIREELLQCNVTDSQDWNARLFAQDWASETKQGFKQSNLKSQCNYRYKIYVEGSAWSVSEKYILSCNSPALIVTPMYYDFFTRGLMPLQHYWPVNASDMCRSIKFAVDWGNRHQEKAQEIGKEGSRFILETLKMDYVYDYMFHLLNEYSKLMRYKPTVPMEAVELCPESMVCQRRGLERRFMMQSMVNLSEPFGPCRLPPPYTPVELEELQRRKERSVKQVEMWEDSNQMI